MRLREALLVLADDLVFFRLFHLFLLASLFGAASSGLGAGAGRGRRSVLTVGGGGGGRRLGLLALAALAVNNDGWGSRNNGEKKSDE